jgi:hypothetical protein
MNAEVDTYMAALDHPMKAGVERLRAAFLASNEALTEHIKWKAPSFCFAGVDRVTFKLYPPVRIQLIFHRGAKVSTAPFAFTDDTGLMTFLAPDRAIVTLDTTADVDAHADTLVALVNRWVAHP